MRGWAGLLQTELEGKEGGEEAWEETPELPVKTFIRR